MEGISMGVPILARRMHSDQPSNAILISQVIKIGLRVKDCISQDKVMKSSAIQGAMEALMASEQGDEIRKRAAELGVAIRGQWTRAEFAWPSWTPSSIISLGNFSPFLFCC
ncbi:hypothetical protein ACJRO7_002326 [Eucalyptus globulus]|uniref:Uncharacterized protein n=1 Tax=Eucalyptus globulus TaxID=34317 RepID=A0ABD3LXE2_EUCGL